MNGREMDALSAHFDKYFHQSSADCTVLHPTVEMKPHIDVMRYPPNDYLPYWKLVTMGASDYKMPNARGTLGNRNEYMMFIDPSEDLINPINVNPYYRYLLEVALYPVYQRCFVTYGHSMEWTVEDGEEMAGAYLEMPQLIPDTGVLRCKLSLLKTATCLQVILLNRAEIDRLLEIGSEAFSNYLYPEDDSRPHFLCELHRSAKF